MNVLSKLAVLGAIGLLFTLASAPSGASPIPEASYLRVDEPLDVGGTILEPGTYVIRVLPSISNRNILQVTNEEMTKVFATVLSVPHPLPATVEQEYTKFVFYPASGNAPRALRTWYAPDSTSHGGHDIVYPERRAAEIAMVVKEPVVAYKDETPTEELKTTTLEVVNPDRQITAYVEPTKPEMPPRVAQLSEGDEMPRTAGNGPLLVLIGSLLLVVGVAARAIRTV